MGAFPFHAEMHDDMAREVLLFHRPRVSALVPTTTCRRSGTGSEMVVISKVSEHSGSVADNPFMAWTAREIEATLIKAAFIAIVVLRVFDVCLIDRRWWGRRPS